MSRSFVDEQGRFLLCVLKEAEPSWMKVTFQGYQTEERQVSPGYGLEFRLIRQ